MLVLIFRRLLAERQIMWSLVVRAGSVILLVGNSVVLARILGAAEFGIYSLALALLALLQIPLAAGMPDLVVRETSAAVQTASHARLSALWRWSGGFLLKLAMAVVLILGPVIVIIGKNHVALPSGIVIMTIVAATIVMFIRVQSAKLRGLGLVIFSQIPEQLLQPGLMILLVLAAAASLHGLAGGGALAVYVGVSALVLCSVTIVLGKVQPRLPKPSADGYDGVPAWRRALMALTIIAALRTASSQAPLIVLGFIGNLHAVANLKLAVSLAAFGTLAAQVVNSVLGPEFARAQAAGDRLEMQSLARRSVGLGVLTSLPVLAGIGLLATPLLTLAYGEQYAGAAGALIMLAGCYAVIALLGASTMILTMTGGERMAFASHFIGFVVTLSLLLVVAPSMGATGAAFAMSAGFIVAQVLTTITVIKALQIDPTIVDVGRYSLALLRSSRRDGRREGYRGSE